jgi:hypothetical protein
MFLLLKLQIHREVLDVNPLTLVGIKGRWRIHTSRHLGAFLAWLYDLLCGLGGALSNARLGLPPASPFLLSLPSS